MEDFLDFYISSTDCTCGSGKIGVHCCYKGNGNFYKTPVDITPPSPKTGFSHPECYLSVSSDCSRKISREHYVSNSILKQIMDDGKLIVHGYPWIPQGTAKSFNKTGALTSFILCERHNNNLSALDNEAYLFFKVMQEISDCFRLNRNLSNESTLLSGESIEKWFLKTLCGLAASRQLRNNESGEEIMISPVWVQILLGKIEWPDKWGLYHSFKETESASMFGTQFIVNGESTELLGVEFFFNNFKFKLVLNDLMPLEENDIFRPTQISFSDKEIVQEIGLTWKDYTNHRPVFYNSPTFPEGPPSNYPNHPIK